MKRNSPAVDQLVRRLPLMDDQAIAATTDERRKDALFASVTSAPRVGARQRSPSRMPRRTLAVVMMMSILTVASIGWAMTEITSDASSSTTVGCHLPDDGGDGLTIVDAVTGDPVADCAAEWIRSTGRQPPDLIAYENTSGGIEVVAAATEVPDGWTRLESSFTQDPRLIALSSTLDDAAKGLRADCYTLDKAKQIVIGVLEEAGLGDWTISPQRGQADGDRSCTYFHLEPATKTVVLVPSDGLVDPGGSPYTVYGRALNQALEQDCLAIDEAQALAARLVDEIALDGPLMIEQVVDDQMACTQASLAVGGRAIATLRGPSNP